MTSKATTVVVTIAMIAVAAAALVYRSYREDLEAATARVSGGSEVVQTPCGPIEYASVGTGTPLLMIHGAGGGFDQGLEIGGDLVREGYRVVAMSRFGYLRTPMPADASPAAQADAHACLLDALGIQRAAIMGVSAGGPSAMQFAIRHPERTTALVLLVPLAYAPRPAGEAATPAPAMTPTLFGTALQFDFLFWVAPKVIHATMVQAILGTPPELLATAEPAERARVEQVLAHILPVSARRLGLLNDSQVGQTIGRFDLERITAPTLLISMADDLYGTYASAQYSAAHIPGARFLGFDHGGHLAIGHNEAITKAIVEVIPRD